MNKLSYIFTFILLFSHTTIVNAYDYSSFRQEYKPTYGSGDSYKNFHSEPDTRLQPKFDSPVHKQLRDFSQDPQSTPRYNSSCQFGMCLPGGPGTVGNYNRY